jgi:type IV secretory pathway TraG/TraD family ATPase VirD4
MTAPTTTTPPSVPSHGHGSGEDAALAAALVLLAVVLALPAVVVALAVWAVARRLSRRSTWALVAVGLAAALVVAGLAPGWRAAAARYEAPYRTIWRALSSHGHLTGHMVLGHVLGTLPAAIPVGLIAGAAWALHRRGSATAEAAGKAPSATIAQLRPLVVRRTEPGRVVLGRLDGKLLASRPERHVCVVAPTRSGKTRGLILPAILGWQGPVVATSAKSDLLYDSTFHSGAYAWRAEQGPVWVFDPSGSSGWPSMQWSPLGRSSTWQGALGAASTMVSAERPAGAGEDNSTGRFFAARAASVLAPTLHAVALAGGGMRDAMALVRGAPDLSDLADTLADGLEAGGAGREALAAVDALRSGSATSSGDVLATLANILAPFDDPQVAKATDWCDFSAAELVETRGSLFVVGGPDSARLSPLYACLLDEVFAFVQEYALQHGPLAPRMLMALDEVANIAPIPDLPSRLATVGGQGITVVTAWQSVAQMARWGPSARSEILGNSAAQLWGASDDPETSEHLAKVLGRQLVGSTSTTWDPRDHNLFAPPTPSSVSQSTVERTVLDASIMRVLGNVLLVHSGLPPTEISWRFYDRDKPLSARASLLLPAIELDDVPEPEPDDEDETPEPVPAPSTEPEPDNWWLPKIGG